MKLGIVGATGLVGKMMIKKISEEKIDYDELVLIASKKSAGKKIKIGTKLYEVAELNEEIIESNFDFLLFSAGSTISKEYAPLAVENGATVIDNSSAFRQFENIPLIIPEINGHTLKNYKGLIANPNCSTIQMLLALNPLHTNFKIKKLVVSTYQAVSGAGLKAVNELKSQENGSKSYSIFSQKIHRNVIPEIGEILESGYSFEEEKMKLETRKILADDSIKICATTVRVPVIDGHSESIYVEFDKEIDLDSVIEIWKNDDHVKYHKIAFTPRNLSDTDFSHVSRLRYGVDKKSIFFWNVAHNLGVGAATNAVRILKEIIYWR